jgi:glucose-6-phosphate 1-dehydrogenase
MAAKAVKLEPFDLVVFGGAGDLAYRKLYLALLHRETSDQFSEPTRIIGVSRRPFDREAFQGPSADAYERRRMDAIRGNAALFIRRDEVEAAWRFIDPIREAWGASHEPPRPYAAGAWGPAASTALIERDGPTWNEEYE